MQPNDQCRNCGNRFTGKYCNECGEKAFHLQHQSVPHLLEDGLHFITHFEGSFFTTLKTILTRPGKLSLDFCNGIRKKYFKPLSFFLMLVVLYLIFPYFEGLNMRLGYHESHSLYGRYAAVRSIEVMQETGLSKEALSDVFQQKGARVSKFLLFIVIPFMALFTWALTAQRRRRYYDQLIFNTEVVSFFILSGFLLLPLLFKILYAINKGRDFVPDRGLALLGLAILFTFTFLAMRRFFFMKWWKAVLISLAYIVVFGLFMEYVYKFLLFIITIHMI